MTTQIQGATFRYSHTIGRGEEAGTGFKNPVALALGAGDVMYVVSRAYDYRGDSKRITICTVVEDYIGEIGNSGRLGGEMMDTGESAAPGSLVWPTDIALDSEENVYVSDEWLNRIAIFTKDGDWIGAWGIRGGGDGELDQPSGIHFDKEDNLYVVDTGNHRIQKYTKDGQFLSQWGHEGSGDGEFNMPWGIEVDANGDVYVADWRNDRIQKFTADPIAIFTKDGDWIGAWGIRGGGDGELDQPSGIHFDKEDNLYVVDTGNHRIQKYTKDGQFLSQWGHEGSGDGEFNMPWGIEVDANGDVYVADWRNDRIQKFTADGQFLMKFGSSGKGPGEFNRPTDVAVDKEGLIYVADWDNDRLQVFDALARFIAEITGDATLSKWGETKLDANPEMRLQREIAQGLEREKFLRGPIGVEVDDQDRIFIVDSQRNRIQIYRKLPPFFLGRYDGGRL